MDQLFERRIVLITGKGGVGRSTVAASLALASAARGRRTLLAEIQEPTVQSSSCLARLFGRENLSLTPGQIAAGLDGCLLQAERGTELFLTSVLKIRAMARLALRSPSLLRLLHAAPSFHEMGIFFHLLTLIRAKLPNRQPTYELLVLDMPATGHTLALTGLPNILLKLIRGGPIARALREGQAILNDPTQSAACVVTLPESLPVTEALELIEGLRETQMPVGGIIANRVPEDPFAPAERESLAPLLQREDLFGLSEFERLRQSAASLELLREQEDLPLLCLDERQEEGRPLIDALALSFQGAASQ